MFKLRVLVSHSESWVDATAGRHHGNIARSFINVCGIGTIAERWLDIEYTELGYGLTPSWLMDPFDRRVDGTCPDFEDVPSGVLSLE